MLKNNKCIYIYIFRFACFVYALSTLGYETPEYVSESQVKMYCGWILKT